MASEVSVAWRGVKWASGWQHKLQSKAGLAGLFLTIRSTPYAIRRVVTPQSIITNNNNGLE